MALECGFTKAAECDPKKLVFLDKVREWCKDGRCGKYGKNWACPPHCGTVDEWRARCAGYDAGVIVETVGLLEDSFDFVRQRFELNGRSSRTDYEVIRQYRYFSCSQ